MKKAQIRNQDEAAPNRQRFRTTNHLRVHIEEALRRMAIRATLPVQDKTGLSSTVNQASCQPLARCRRCRRRRSQGPLSTSKRPPPRLLRRILLPCCMLLPWLPTSRTRRPAGPRAPAPLCRRTRVCTTIADRGGGRARAKARCGTRVEAARRRLRGKRGRRWRGHDESTSA
jgi:hypothetical protein